MRAETLAETLPGRASVFCYLGTDMLGLSVRITSFPDGWASLNKRDLTIRPRRRIIAVKAREMTFFRKLLQYDYHCIQVITTRWPLGWGAFQGQGFTNSENIPFY